MKNIVAERIQARMEELGKNPSSVALEAGLGRSSVRDIILGRVAHPRIDTLKKIAAPLQCTVDYLMGDSAEPDTVSVRRRYWHMDAQIDIPTEVEAGVFRRPAPRTSVERPDNPESVLNVALQDPRIPTWYPALYVMRDNSMAGAGIAKGDGLTGIADPFDRQIPLTHGAIVAVRQSLHDLELEEISIRQVEVRPDGLALICPGVTEIPPLIISQSSIDDASSFLANRYRAQNSLVEIMHLITRVTRELPLSDAMYDFSPEPD